MSASYSQQGQDLFAELFFTLGTGASTEYFVDVGALDGIRFSNVRRFYDKGWHGICIEAAQDNYKRLACLYEGTSVQAVHAAVSDREGTATINAVANVLPSGERAGAGTLIDEQMDRWDGYEWRKERVPMRRLDSILAANDVDKIALVSIDVEGAEIAVLNGFDVRRFRPDLLIIEHNGRQEDILTKLKPLGYELWFGDTLDVFVARIPSGWRGRVIRALGLVFNNSTRLKRGARRLLSAAYC